MCFLLLKYFLNAYRELRRLMKTTNSPMVSQLSESITGATTIRSFHKEESYTKEARNFLNININVEFWNKAIR